MKEKIIINELNSDYDTLFEKARALVFNEQNKIYVCNMNGTYMLPGGTVENNESPLITLKRELKEELGLIKYNLEELVEIDYYHHNFPKLKSDLYENRLNIVYYYFIKIHSNDLGTQMLTDYEKEQNIRIEEYSIEEIKEKIKFDNDNKYSNFTNKELQIILNYINEKGWFNELSNIGK